jgi:hypothetical protein
MLFICHIYIYTHYTSPIYDDFRDGSLLGVYHMPSEKKKSHPQMIQDMYQRCAVYQIDTSKTPTSV